MKLVKKEPKIKTVTVSKNKRKSSEFEKRKPIFETEKELINYKNLTSNLNSKWIIDDSELEIPKLEIPEVKIEKPVLEILFSMIVDSKPEPKPLQSVSILGISLKEEIEEYQDPRVSHKVFYSLEEAKRNLKMFIV